MASEIPDYRSPPGSQIPGTASDPSDFQDQIRGYLRRRRRDGNAYVKSNQVADEFDVMAQRAAKNLESIAADGDVESWGSGGVWKITLDEEGDDGE